MVHMKGLPEHRLGRGKDYNLVEEALPAHHILQFVGKGFAGLGKGSAVGSGMDFVVLGGEGILEMAAGHTGYLLVPKIRLDFDCSC